ncbi:MAG: hypothetical protein HKP25_16055 [Marinicaulis sp.]|nr:hypothetical protein [Marinicaulis sp.]NNL90574.1 hypothetical protein [Marinicaulis sp.]
MEKLLVRCLLLGGLSLILYIGFFWVVNRSHRAVSINSQGEHSVAILATEHLTVTTWNVGYGALGAESDFVADGGKNLLPPSRQVVDKNIAGIARELNGVTSDVVILQEVAGPSILNRGGDPIRAIDDAFGERDNAFSEDFSLRFAPPPFAPKHGLYSSLRVSRATREIVKLPLEPGYMLGVAKRRYHLHVVRIPFSEGEWTIINLHLSAFDDGADVRRRQLRAVLNFAVEEFSQGRHVVIGGDWNLEFVRPVRPSTTGDEDLFWIHPFPVEELAAGWRIAVDEKTPSVRTNERPYRRGENFTTVIDGFVVSPNVVVESVETRDTDFQFTDHQAVTLNIRALAE